MVGWVDPQQAEKTTISLAVIERYCRK